MGVTNTVVAAEGGIYLHVGIEMSVSLTKAFTSQLAVLSMLALLMARTHDMDAITGRQYIRALLSLLEVTKEVLELSGPIHQLAQKYAHYHRFLFLGPQEMYPIALEGALKLKEVAYVDAFSRAVLRC